MWLWAALIVSVVAALAVFFVVIARKGRALRINQPLPAVAHAGFIEFTQNGRQRKKEVVSPFYFGKSIDCEVVLPDAGMNFEACIFYYNRRFAIQVLTGGGPLMVNGEEMLAGYLRDGDALDISGHHFVFRCS
jgi:hypothetical protein